MNLHTLTENDLSFVLEIALQGKKIGEVTVPVRTKSSVVMHLVHEVEEGLVIERLERTRH